MTPEEAVLAETRRIIERVSPRDPFEAVEWMWRAYADGLFSFWHAMADMLRAARTGEIR